MKRTLYNRIDLIVRITTTSIALLVAYGGIYFSDSFWVAALIIFVGLLPYLIGYNLWVRGWLFRRIED